MITHAGLRRIGRFVAAQPLRALVLVGALAGATTLVATRGAAPPRAEAVARHHLFTWPAGSKLVYTVKWDSASRRTLLGAGEGGGNGDVAGGAIFEGDVSVRSLGADAEGVTSLVYTLEQIRGYSLRLGAQDLISESDRQLAAAALAGQEAIVRVDALGVVHGVSYHHDTPASTRELLSQLTNMMRVTLPAEEKGSTWMAKEPTSNGLAHVRYDDEGHVLHRVRISYEGLASLVGQGEADQRLGSKASIELDPKGFVRLIDDREELRAQHDDVSFTSLWTFKAAVASQSTFDVAAVRTSDLDTGAISEELARERERGRDQRLSEGWDLGTIEVELLLYGNGKKVDPSFVARASAFMRLHPESLANLVSWFEEPRVSDFGKQLTLDVLSATGTEQAQDAMRRALTSKAVTLSSPLRAAMIQRFIFVPHPTPESARFVADVYTRAFASGDNAVGYAAAVTLGAIVEHMEGSPALSEELDKRLCADLAAAPTKDWAIALVRALGNARTNDALPAIAARYTDTNSGVRDEVARSLRRFDDPRASGPLLVLARDASPEVGRAAFLGLREQSLTDEQWETLARAVEAGETSLRADTKLVDLIERRPDSGERGQRMLRAIRERTPKASGNVDLLARIDGALTAGK